MAYDKSVVSDPPVYGSYSVRQRLGEPVRELRVGPEGLSLVGRSGRTAVTPWANVYGVEWLNERRGALLLFRDQAWRLDGRVEEWRRLAEGLDQELRRSRGAEVDPAWVEHWLGLQPGGWLVSRKPLGHRWGKVLVFLVLSVVSVLLSLTVWYIQWAWHVWGYWFCVDTIAADGNGLAVRRGPRSQRYAWSELVRIEAVGWTWRVRTKAGSFRIWPRTANAGRIAGVIMKVIAFGRGGMAAPADLPMSDAAISRVTGEADASPERGISLGDEPPASKA